MVSMTGASILHGPQVGEKKSTMTGFEVILMNPGKAASSSSTGTAALPREIAVLHLPHLGPRCCLSAGILFLVEQLLQAMTKLFTYYLLISGKHYLKLTGIFKTSSNLVNPVGLSFFRIRVPLWPDKWFSNCIIPLNFTKSVVIHSPCAVA